jgi:hypothetical protein
LKLRTDGVVFVSIINFHSTLTLCQILASLAINAPRQWWHKIFERLHSNFAFGHCNTPINYISKTITDGGPLDIVARISYILIR